MSDQFKTALIEGMRVVVLSVIAVVLASIQQGQVIDLKVLWGAGLVAALKFLDKYLHEVGKETDNELLTTGITRF